MAAQDASLDFADLLDRDVAPRIVQTAQEAPPPVAWLQTLIGLVAADPHRRRDRPRRLVEALVAEIDASMSGQMNAILHHPEFQEVEVAWRGLWMLVMAADGAPDVKIKVLNISKRELSRTLRKFRGTAWDQSPIFKRFYEEEFGQFGGQPYAVLIGAYDFDHKGDDVAVLTDMSRIASAAHSPFIAAAAPSLMQMDAWEEVANPRDLVRIFTTPDYVAWRALRDSEDARYLGLCMPRYLARLPYGGATDPLDAFAFEEQTEGDNANLLWGNPAFPFAANLIRAFVDYGWCVRIRGIDRGGVVHNLPVMRHPTADGDTDRRTVTEICLTERRESEITTCGLIPLVHRKNSDIAAFISAQSLQKPRIYDDPDATANANLSARLPYLFACARFAHYVKCMVRDKIGSTMTRAQLQHWLHTWLLGYVDGSPATSTEDFKAAHPLSDARVDIFERPPSLGMYDARIFLQPHYQLEGLSVALRLVSRLPNQ